jgi:hypothetical protein
VAGCFGIGMERTLKMQAGLRMTSQAMLGYAEHPFRHRPESRIGNLAGRVGTSFRNVECLLIARRPHRLSPKCQICGYLPLYIVETESQLQGLGPGYFDLIRCTDRKQHGTCERHLYGELFLRSRSARIRGCRGRCYICPVAILGQKRFAIP